jgi:hypothetical protein
MAMMNWLDSMAPLTAEAIQKIVSHAVRSALREVDVAAKYNQWQYAVILPQTNAAWCFIGW